VNARRARHLRDARNGHFHFRRGHQHQIRQFVNNDYDVAELVRDDNIIVAWHHNFIIQFNGKPIGTRLDLFFFGRQRQLRLGRDRRLAPGALVEGLDVADADLGENVVSAFPSPSPPSGVPG